MNEWIKGNKPSYSGLYWVTVDEAGIVKMYDVPMYYDRTTWTLNNNKYYADNIIAYIPCNRPSEPYNELHIGYPNQYYIRIKHSNITRYLSKGLMSVKQSKIGYDTKEKAIAAMRRLRKDYSEDNKTEIVIVNGNGEEI